VRVVTVVHYTISGSTKTDVLIGSRPSCQRFGSVLNVTFPEDDGEIRNSSVTNAAAAGPLRAISYANADRYVQTIEEG
jgi:hypothetical protein